MPTPGSPPPPDAGVPPPGGKAPPPEPTTTGRQPSLVLVGLFILILALGVIAWLVFLSGLFTGGADPSASPSASASASASAEPSASASVEPSGAPSEPAAPTPSPSAAAGPAQVSWAPASGIDPTTAQIGGVELIGGRWIAVGGVMENFLTAAIWISDDGATWTRATLDTTEVSDEYTYAFDVAAVGDALVAVGSWGAVPSDQRSWVSWTSTDGGATWTEAREENMPALGAVASGGPGLVGAQWNYSGTTPFDTTMVTSTDGATWELTATLEMAAVYAIDVIGDRIVAVGNVQADPNGESEAAAWYSDDGGVTWTPADVPDGGALLTMQDLAVLGGGLAAIGAGGANASVSVDAWRTADGATWEQFGIADGAIGSGLAAVDGGLVAVGNLAGQDIGPGTSWLSPDAEVWLESEALGIGDVRLGAAAGDGDTVVAGGRCEAESCDTVIWIGQVTR
jgi:hypothetical protein